MLGYEGKRVLVVGGATGMGAATAQEAAKLGAEVTVLDVADVTFPVKEFVKIDLRDKASIDAVVDKLQGPFQAVFSCAGVADGARGLPQINYIGQRYLIEKLVSKGALPRGSAVGVISSTAGNGWEQGGERMKAFLALPADDWDKQLQWIEANKTDNPYTSADGYCFSKQAMCAYVANHAYELLKKGIRINSILPGPTDTPLARANADIWLAFAQDYRASVDLQHLQPREMAEPLLFLCSPWASGITAENLVVDQGYTSSQIMGKVLEAVIREPYGSSDSM
jgi:NAD(P)-dependent dehydrogenase (short-subunit alcohol dehydrogenase family)